MQLDIVAAALGFTEQPVIVATAVCFLEQLVTVTAHSCSFVGLDLGHAQLILHFAAICMLLHALHACCCMIYMLLQPTMGCVDDPALGAGSWQRCWGFLTAAKRSAIPACMHMLLLQQPS